MVLCSLTTGRSEDDVGPESWITLPYSALALNVDDTGNTFGTINGKFESHRPLFTGNLTSGNVVTVTSTMS